MDLGDAAGRRPSPTRPPCSGRRIWGPEQSRTNSLQSSQPVSGRFASMGRPLYSEKRSGRGIHSFLAHLALGVDLITGLKGVNLVRFNPDGMVNLLHSLLSVRFDLYSASQRIFAYWGGSAFQGPPPGGGHYQRGLRGAALYLRRSTIGPNDAPGGNLPTGLADDAMLEFGEDGWVGVLGLGFPGGWLSSYQTVHPGCWIWRRKNFSMSSPHPRICSPC